RSEVLDGSYQWTRRSPPGVEPGFALCRAALGSGGAGRPANRIVVAAFKAAIAKGLRLQMPELVHEVMGSGLEGIIAGQRVRAGSQQLIFGAHRPDDWALRARCHASWRSALSVFVSVDDRVIGALLLADELRKETPRAVQSLRAAGVARIVMVTGDRADA